ncbi:dockerin type I domain-containing protein [Deinococcus cellulosilyticus]|uniref:Dockerin domain-containing protein n=1 Tax=Deinococcus cellulosilyticus (strain DSM 18568 / NBRC 106333 / KACC 11606 / 5516J-15) TaxID=1223518 RepID=A0A511N642_DEIC1|nr:dockerin type I domain-containing protein [Deinococcus cellulosilyticus]GEM47938.1 hypothetical protein DC3_35730 [Deinococcus cellulosilyticus NBRC 106333 = KACC 11606]
MKWLVTLLLISGLAFAQTTPPADGGQPPVNETQNPEQPSTGTGTEQETPANPDESPEDAGETPADPAQEQTPVAPAPTSPATAPNPATEQPAQPAPETPKFPVVKIPVTVPEALRAPFQNALKVFSHDRVPLEAEFVASADTQFQTETDIPFNPDAGSRTLTSGNKRQVWINTATTLSQDLIWRVEAAKLLKLPDPTVLPKERTLTEQDKMALKTQFASKGDFNGDDRVDLLDLIILAKNMGVENPQKGDLNQDGTVNDQDYALFQQLYTR